jgi:hypothetical protein
MDVLRVGVMKPSPVAVSSRELISLRPSEVRLICSAGIFKNCGGVWNVTLVIRESRCSWLKRQRGMVCWEPLEAKNQLPGFNKIVSQMCLELN